MNKRRNIKWCSEIKENKYLSDVQEDKNIKLKKIIKTIEAFRMEFNKEIETLKRTQADIKTELEN